MCIYYNTCSYIFRNTCVKIFFLLVTIVLESLITPFPVTLILQKIVSDTAAAEVFVLCLACHLTKIYQIYWNKSKICLNFVCSFWQRTTTPVLSPTRCCIHHRQRISPAYLRWESNCTEQYSYSGHCDLRSNLWFPDISLIYIYTYLRFKTFNLILLFFWVNN